jgi:ectoine hydroxylase-related dioxygenase (phytanoyl-CoA dioxygenase family)
MLATWVALEDVDLASGPLFYYPRSHLIAPYRFRDGRYNMTPEEADQCFSYVHDTIKKEGISQTPLIARKGDVFIWHAHLLHGGAAILDRTRTRRSLVTHFFRHGDPMGGIVEVEFQKNRFYLPREFLSAEES